MIKLKNAVLSFLFDISLVADKSLTILERVELFFKALLALSPIAFLLEISKNWFLNNQKFTTAIILIIFINMILGASMHLKRKNFKWKKFITKTLIMLVVINVTYIVLELIISRAGDNFVVDGFRSVLQIATLLYPGSKILKNIFILSNGEHPPKWMMERVYNFQKNGDLKQFLAQPENKLETIEKSADLIQEKVKDLRDEHTD